MSPACWLNLPLPGAGLVVRGRVVIGVSLLLPALLASTALLLVAAVATADFAAGVRGWLIGAHLGLAVVATGWHAWLERPRSVDAAVVRDLHREAAIAFLSDRHDAAIAAADRLVRCAPAEVGAWRLLALVADAAGDRARAARAARRMARLSAEREV